MSKGKINATTIQISSHIHEILRSLEKYPKESFNNIVIRLIRYYTGNKLPEEIEEIEEKKIFEFYMDEEWLYNQYIILKKSPPEIAKECGVSIDTIRHWLRKRNIPLRSYSEAQKINQNKLEVRTKKSGENSNMWKKWDELTYRRKHGRIRKMLEKMGIFKPIICPICDKKHNKIDLMNIDHQYKENTLDYYYMCNHCHTGVYEYLAGLVEGHKTIKSVPNLIGDLLKLKTRIEREKLLKEIILNC